MDPNASLFALREALRLSREATDKVDAYDALAVARDHAEALDQWMSKGELPPSDWHKPITGADVTGGASDEAETCGCGEPITFYDGVWMHIFNEDLRGTNDHDAEPG